MSDKTLSETIGNFIKRHRLKQNKTQDEVATAAGLSRSTLSLLERGENVALSSLLQVLRVLDLLFIMNEFKTNHEISPKEYAKQQAMKININGVSMGEVELNKNKDPEGWTTAMGHTTHLSTADKNGMMVALTQSLGPNMGSKVASPELGFLYAVTLGRYLGVYLPGQRAASFISPFIITKDNQPFMALGAAGGSRIVSAITAVSTRVIDHQLSLDKALMAPRVYPNKNTIQLETHAGTGWKSAFTEELKKEGFEVDIIDKPARFGRVHAVLFDAKTGRWIGGADPDWEGAVSNEK